MAANVGEFSNARFGEFKAATHTISGVELILTPTANMAPYDSVATRLVPARAQENGVYLVYANYVGSEPPFEYCGLSCICAPDGNDVARAGRTDEMIYGDLSKQVLKEARKSVPYLTGIRTGLYGAKSLPEKSNE